MFETMIKTHLVIVGFYQSAVTGLHDRARARRNDDAGLATLEWVALIIVAVGLAIAAGVAVTRIMNNKIAEIP